MKKLFAGLLLCMMLLCITAVSFGSDGAKIDKDPGIVLVEDYSVDVDLQFVSPVVITAVPIVVAGLDPCDGTNVINITGTSIIGNEIPIDPGLCLIYTSTTRNTKYATAINTEEKDIIWSNHTGKLIDSVITTSLEKQK